jgi:nitrogen fixation NifU-like protein
MSLSELYRQVIMDHYQSPRNRGVVPDADIDVGLNNPTCGDEVRLTVRLGPGDVVEDARFVGQGCSISMAAASMMTEAIRGRPLAEALALAEDFKAFLRREPVERDLGELKALEGVAQFPMRVKCATLAFNALVKGAAARPH